MATPSERQRLIRVFPNLANEDFDIICPESTRYNCIAYAAGDTSQPWSDESGDYWPLEVPRSPTIGGLENLFRWLGFEKCRRPRLPADYLNVALYASEGLWQHAALQMPTAAGAASWVKGGRLSNTRRPLASPVRQQLIAAQAATAWACTAWIVVVGPAMWNHTAVPTFT